jgi:DNA topoisomerase VI subunit B
MREAFSFSREYDYIRMEGLSRATGRPPHEWDLYILKELIDNALDADEALWSKNISHYPSVSINIRLEYIKLSQNTQLLVRVENRAPFPVESIEAIFATQWYTSHKAFLKGLTRGALGNALKTLLGIPYALRNRGADDWNPETKPLSIKSNGKEYLPQYIIDPIAQTLQLVCEETKSRRTNGTIVTVQADYFVQERPRSLADIEAIAEQYHLCNPHAQFSWAVEIDARVWHQEYKRDQAWDHKFRGSAPIQWYTLTAFKDLLAALYRETCYGQENCSLPLEAIYWYFENSRDEANDIEVNRMPLARLSEMFERLKGRAALAKRLSPATEQIITILGQDRLTDAEIKGTKARDLYSALYSLRAPFDSIQLGSIGPEHVHITLSNMFQVEGNVHYMHVVDGGSDPIIPFVIEVAAARLKEGKREVLTAINLSPTYRDPLISSYLYPPLQNNSVLGLRGFLDAYDFREDTPMVLFMHLICPNIEHNEYSKSEINALPFKDQLGKVLDQLLKELRQDYERAEQQIERRAIEILDEIVKALGENERPIFDQLIEQLRKRKEPALLAWLERPGSLERLRIHFSRGTSGSTTLTERVVRSVEGVLNIPLHPDQYVAVAVDRISRSFLAQNHVNKILYVQPTYMETVILNNNFLCRMDMALLHTSSDAGSQQEIILECLHKCDLPFIVLHDAGQTGAQLVEQIRTWLIEYQLEDVQVIDLGLHAPTEGSDSHQPTRLVEIMPNELCIWLLQQFEAVRLPVKSMPSRQEMRRDIRDRFEQFLRSSLVESISQQFELTKLLIALDREVGFTMLMQQQGLDETLRSHLEQVSNTQDYTTILDEVVGKFFERFMYDNGEKVRSLQEIWLSQRQGR